MQNDILAMHHACHTICTLSPLDAALTNAISKKNTQHDTSKLLRLPRKMNMDTSNKCCTCHEKGKPYSENLAAGLRLSHKTTFDTICRHVRMSRPATPATQNDIEPVDTATLQENQRIETRHIGISKRAFRARLPSNFHTL